MKVLICYEFQGPNDKPAYNWCITEHETVESAVESFKHQNPYLKPLCARELKGQLYL